ncbi:MAG: tripartite tricarboxylate transporter permease [Thermoanaerobacteraceae bacterium]|nr:tripartite tricarboxylate transporter permease [Thermoanaerobacteraceae bacterium]
MGDIFSNLAYGLQTALTFNNILWVVIGGLLGTIVGMLPGLGPATGIAVLLPIIFGMNPSTAMITMAAIYYGAMFGGSRASIMINTPGDASAIATCFDGYPMTKNGEGGKALAMSAIASFVGGLIATVLMIFLTQPIAGLALDFGPAEMFSILLFALTATVTLSQGNILKGFVSIFTGFMLSTIGIDSQTGLLRFTFGLVELQEGIEFLVVMIGMYAIAEVYKNYNNINTKYDFDSKFIGSIWISKEEFKKCLPAMLRSTPLGFVIGALPGLGGSVAALTAYAIEKQSNKHPERFGKGAIEGVAAPEAANNAASTGALIPMLTLGIPGSATTAVMVGALMMIGVKPGPLLFTEHPDVAWGVIASMLIGNVILIIINLPLVVPLVQLLRIPQRILLPLILGLGFMGAYFLSYSSFDFILLVIFGFLGYLMSKLDIPVAPLVLALILGSDTEQYFRRAMGISHGSLSIFFTKPISLVFLILAVVSFIYSIRREQSLKKNMQEGA